MRIFITGASGFVGGAATKKLKESHQIFAMARSQKSAEKIRQLGAEPVLCELGAVEVEHLKDCDIIIHSAAFVEEWGDPKEFWKINVEGTSQLLEVARKAEVSRFVFIGTEAALFYGQHMREIDETYPYAENSPILYSKTKAQAEKRVLGANDCHNGFTTISLRPRMIWGPGDTTILPVVKEMVATKKFMWINQGKMKTSTVYIDNLVSAIELALTKGRGGEAYFITDDETQIFRDFLTKMMATQSVKMPEKSISSAMVCRLASVIEGLWRMFMIKSKPPITRHAAYVMTYDCTLKIDKARKELGYSPVVSVEEGLSRMG